jgi:hypothetical protein
MAVDCEQLPLRRSAQCAGKGVAAVCLCVCLRKCVAANSQGCVFCVLLFKVGVREGVCEFDPPFWCASTVSFFHGPYTCACGVGDVADPRKVVC